MRLLFITPGVLSPAQLYQMYHKHMQTNPYDEIDDVESEILKLLERNNPLRTVGARLNMSYSNVNRRIFLMRQRGIAVPTVRSGPRLTDEMRAKIIEADKSYAPAWKIAHDLGLKHSTYVNWKTIMKSEGHVFVDKRKHK